MKVRSARRMPRQKPGLSVQDYATPWPLIRAIEAQYGAMHVDLAATAVTSKAPRYVSPHENAFSFSWAERFRGKRCWLNPPFGRIAPWARKCAEEGPRMGTGGQIFFLTPASVGATWFAEHVHGKAAVVALHGRLSFDGIAPYPKDCMVSVFGSVLKVGFYVWDWRE